MSKGLKHVPDSEKNVGSKGDTHTSVLADIRTRPTLKAVPKEQRGTNKRLVHAATADPALVGLTGMIATAMATRRIAVGNAENDDEDDGWDD